jgi:hypothetical protein
VTGAAVVAYAEACVRAAYESWLPADGTVDDAGEPAAACH